MNKKKYTIIILSAIGLLFLVRPFAEPYQISGDCMEPAFKDGQLYFLNRALPYLRQYQIGDVVIFNHENKPWIARIVALETNTIKITEGNVTVNNLPLIDIGIYRNWSNWKYGA